MKSNQTKIKWIITDEQKMINEQCIKWVQKIKDCFEVCTRSTGL